MNDAEELNFGCFRLVPRRRELWRHDEPLQLGSRAFDLLLALVGRQGRVATKDELMSEIWPGTVVEENNLAAQVSALRRVLEDDPHSPRFLRTVAGRGYQFVARVERSRRDEPFNGASTASELDPALSLVVLPFANLGSDPDQAHLSVALTDALTTDLSRISGLLVIASATAAAISDGSADVRQICSNLGVRFALTGSIQTSRQVMRLNAQLVDGDRGLQLWSDRFDGDTSDLLALQDQITGRIANSIGRELVVVAVEMARRHKAAPSSTEMLLKGIALADKPVSLANLRQQEHLFGQAILLDQDSGEAQARFARAVLLQVVWFSASFKPQERRDKLRQGAQAAERAVALDPTNARAHLAMGVLHVARGEFEQSILANETAIAFDRNLALAHNNLGHGLLHCGAARRAIQAIEQAIRLDPRGPQVSSFQCAMGMARLFLGEVEAAVDWYALARSSNRGLPRAHAGLAIALARAGKLAPARDVASDLLRLAPDFRFSETLHAPSETSSPDYHRFFDEIVAPAARSVGVPV